MAKRKANPLTKEVERLTELCEQWRQQAIRADAERDEANRQRDHWRNVAAGTAALLSQPGVQHFNRVIAEDASKEAHSIVALMMKAREEKKEPPKAQAKKARKRK